MTCTREEPDADCKSTLAESSTVKSSLGTVKMFSDRKGFGSITHDEGDEDIFAHCSAINMPGFKTLKNGQRVSFDMANGAKGKQASSIRSAG